MEEACETMKREDASLPQDTFDKTNRNMREMINTPSNTDTQQPEKTKHLSVNYPP